ncbi:MAG: OmpA family protein [Cytophagales bacterium]
MRSFFLISTFLVMSLGFSQNPDQKVGVGLNVGLREYNGDLGNGYFNFNTTYPSIGVWGGYYVNKFFDAKVNLNYGFFGFENQKLKDRALSVPRDTVFGANFSANMFNAMLLGKFKFNNGSILKEDAMFAPYLVLGLGFASTSQTKVNSIIRDRGIDGSILIRNFVENEGKSGSAFKVPFGAGLRIRIEENVDLNFQVTQNFIFSDELDNSKGGSSMDNMLQYNLGFVVNIGKPKDSDKDGVPDKTDKCPNTRTGVKVDEFGCDLDTDGDGVADFDDECPEVAGLIKGCPDGDNDGIADKDDECPEIPGIEAFKGCPDTDGDGIKDSEDECPTLAGLAQYNGCPDTDGDGFIDPKDECPKVAGTVRGCPDADGDGVADKDDKCPNTPGLAENKGCPEIKKEILERAKKSAGFVYFETGKDVLKKESFKALNELLDILKSDTNLECEIDGHTDNVGDPAKNKRLSQDRADAVKNYLIVKGIDSSRLKAIGFGEEKPKADNNTKEGQAKNRRVEFILSY